MKRKAAKRLGLVGAQELLGGLDEATRRVEPHDRAPCVRGRPRADFRPCARGRCASVTGPAAAAPTRRIGLATPGAGAWAATDPVSAKSTHSPSPQFHAPVPALLHVHFSRTGCRLLALSRQAGCRAPSQQPPSRFLAPVPRPVPCGCPYAICDPPGSGQAGEIGCASARHRHRAASRSGWVTLEAWPFR